MDKLKISKTWVEILNYVEPIPSSNRKYSLIAIRLDSIKKLESLYHKSDESNSIYIYTSYQYDYRIEYSKDKYELFKKELNELKSALFIP